MSNEPFSGMPAGSPSDSNLLCQTNIVTLSSEKITQLQLFNYIASKAINNVFYVNSSNGIDAVGRGSYLTPFASISYAISQISSHSTVTLLQCYGDFTETNLSLPVNCYIYGNNSTLTVTNQVTADSSWNSASGAIFFKDFFNLNFQAGMLLDISSATFGVIQIQNINCNTNELFKIVGNGSGAGTGICIIENIYGFSNIPSIEIENCYGGISGGAPVNLTIKNTSTVNDYVSTLSNLQLLGNLSLESSNGKILQVNKTACYINGSYTINGTGVLLNSDPANSLPTLTGGATLSQITYRDLSDTLSAGFTPTGYTPTDDQVKGHLEGINNEFNVGGSRIPFGVSGGGITGDSSFTYDIVNKRLAVNNIRALSANIAGLNGSGYFEFNSSVDVTLTNNPPFGPYTKIFAVFTATGKKIILPDSTEPFAIQSSNGGSILITNQSPTISFQVETFLGDIIYNLQPLESINIWIADNPSGSYFVEQLNENLNVLGAGTLNQTVNTSPIQLSNPCPNFLLLDGAGPGPLMLPKMNDTNSLTSGRNTFIFVNPAPTFTNPIAVYDFGGVNQQFILQPGVAYLGFVTSNSSDQGTFNWTKFNIDSIPVIRGTSASITSITPSEETFGVATDTKQLLYYNMTSWVISA